MDYSRLCMGCMRTLEHNDSAFCPFCGYRIGTVNSSRGLQPKTVLNGKYLVGKIIGEGGFGITYLAYDMVLNYRVAIKEYFPSELVTRDTSTGVQTALTVLTGSREERYKAGIERFVNEARNLAAFNNLDGIVSVKEFFYENNTAYMVMEYIDGISLSQYLNNNGNRLPYQQVISMLTPIMNSLEKVHESNIIHRDISPDNIMVSNDGRVKLIDFGAARMVDPDNKSLTVILKHGYAPEEQYQSKGNQGPWTDVYALAATMYRMITGTVPQEATDRIISGDKVVPVNKPVSEVPRHVSDAIMHGLAIKASDRPQSISVFRKELEKGPKKKFPFFIIPIAAAVALCVVGAVVAVNVIKNKQSTTEPDYVATKHSKSKTSEPVSEEESELPPVKELTEEEKQALWREYQDKIMECLGYTSDNTLHGCFDDFDQDGDYELFLSIGDWFLAGVLYADTNGMWIESKDTFIKLEQGTEQLDYLINYLKESGEEDNMCLGDSILDFPMTICQFGDQKICCYDYIMAGVEEYGCFVVMDKKPQFFKECIKYTDGIVLGSKPSRIRCFTKMGEELQIGSFEAKYAPYFYDGRFGELASCMLAIDQYSLVDGLTEQIVSAADTLEMGVFIDEGSSGADGSFIIDEATLDSVYYNESGYYIINFKCICTFEWAYYMHEIVSVGDLEEEKGDVLYTGTEENKKKDSIEGIYAHVILKQDGNNYSILESGPGFLGSSVTDNVLVESTCPWIE